MLPKQNTLKLISPSDIRNKTQRIWQKGAILSAWLNHDDIFPLDITFRKPCSAEMLACFEQVRDWIVVLQQQSKAESGKGYSLAFKQLQHRKMGEQQVPSRIYFEHLDDFLSFTQHTKAYATFQVLTEQTLAAFPLLKEWLGNHPLKLLKHASIWGRLLLVCAWFQEHPHPNQYIRELNIQGVDSKFIELNKAILVELLKLILPQAAMDISVSGLASHGFERRFGLKYDEPLVRFRLGGAVLGFSDISVPLSQFVEHPFDVDTVFITENKINGLTFPLKPREMVIFGLGYGIEMLKNIAGIQHKRIIYWGDIDTHGFAILSQLRSYFPHATSLCMNEEALLQHKSLWGNEPSDKHCRQDLVHLTQEEQILFQQLQSNYFGHSLRLEQERIDHTYLQQQLKEF